MKCIIISSDDEMGQQVNKKYLPKKDKRKRMKEVRHSAVCMCSHYMYCICCNKSNKTALQLVLNGYISIIFRWIYLMNWPKTHQLKRSGLQALKSKTLNFSAGIYLMNSEYSFIYTLLYAENSPV